MNLIVNQINYGLTKAKNSIIDLFKNDILMYSTFNEDNFVIFQMFMKTLKAKIYKK